MPVESSPNPSPSFTPDRLVALRNSLVGHRNLQAEVASETVSALLFSLTDDPSLVPDIVPILQLLSKHPHHRATLLAAPSLVSLLVHLEHTSDSPVLINASSKTLVHLIPDLPAAHLSLLDFGALLRPPSSLASLHLVCQILSKHPKVLAELDMDLLLPALVSGLASGLDPIVCNAVAVVAHRMGQEMSESLSAASLLSIPATSDEAQVSVCWVIVAGETLPFGEDAVVAQTRNLTTMTVSTSPTRTAAVNLALGLLPGSALVLCALLAPCRELRDAVPSATVKTLIAGAQSEATKVLAGLLVMDNAQACAAAWEELMGNGEEFKTLSPADEYFLAALASSSAGTSWPHVMASLRLDEALARRVMAHPEEAVDACRALAFVCAHRDASRVRLIAMGLPRALAVEPPQLLLLTNLACVDDIEAKRDLAGQLAPLSRFVTDLGVPVLRNLSAGGPLHAALVQPLLPVLAGLADSSALIELTANCACLLDPASDPLADKARLHLVDSDDKMRLAAIRSEFNFALQSRPMDIELVRLLAEHDPNPVIQATARLIVERVGGL